MRKRKCVASRPITVAVCVAVTCCYAYGSCTSGDSIDSMRKYKFAFALSQPPTLLTPPTCFERHPFCLSPTHSVSRINKWRILSKIRIRVSSHLILKEQIFISDSQKSSQSNFIIHTAEWFVWVWEWELWTEGLCFSSSPVLFYWMQIKPFCTRA